MLGGWRIVKTMGQKITKLRPQGGFAAETGAIVGVGSAQRTRAVRWGVAGNIVFAGIITMPAAALMAALAYWAGTLIM